TLDLLQNETDSSDSNVSSLSLLTTTLPVSLMPPTGPPPTPAASIYSLRLALTIIHLFLVSIGSINLLVIFVILIRPYMRSITNVYMISLCLADFIYLANLTLVAATQLNDRSWRFGSFLCTVYHGTETTGKYASVLFVVLLAADRYCAMCKANWCSRYRTYRWAITLSILAWALSIFAATPLYFFSEVVMLRYRFVDKVQQLCIAKWPSSEAAKCDVEESKYFVNKVKTNKIIRDYNRFSGQSNERLLSSSVIQINQDYPTDFIRFKPSTAHSDIVSVLKKTSFNDTTSMYIIGEKTVLMPINGCHTSKSFETLPLMTDKKQIMAEIVSKWSVPYRPHSNGPQTTTKNNVKNGILRHHSSETLTVKSHKPINTLASLNSVAMTLDDENSPECRLSPSPSPIFEFDQQSTDLTTNTSNFVPSPALIHAGDVFI
uniref:G-protein coupled receptors family 1 profile domain-containing protein n=1 Tax=Panagrolaimus sp. JU765 TaxID=591449 RepID=A0AC34RSV0_9BILA